MIDLRKQKHGATGVVLVTLLTLFAMLVLGVAYALWLLNAETYGGGAIRSAVVQERRAPPRTAVEQAGLAQPVEWVRLETYDRFDPRTSELRLTRVRDQWGCGWWMQIGSPETKYGYVWTSIAYRPDGRPDCPADAMPKPYVDFVDPKDEADFVKGMTVVDRRMVANGDEKLIAYLRRKRDRAAELSSN